MEEKESILDNYLDKHFKEINPDDETFQSYYRIADGVLDHTNFLLFPIEETKSTDDDKTINRTFKCDLVVEKDEFGNDVKERQIEIDWKTLQNFESLKSYLGLQEPLIKFKNLRSRTDKEELCAAIQRGLLEGYKQVFGCKTSEKLNRLGFKGENNDEFIFNNGILNLSTGKFVPGEYSLAQNASIKISYPWEEIENLTLEESLTDILSLKKYISSDNSVNSIVLGYLIAGIFRNESKTVKNEFPFLGIQSVTNAGKTSLLNFLSWVCGFDWKTILGTNDSEYAFEVGMNCMSSRYYFFDEIQKASAKLLKYIQAAYNSGENHKGGGSGNWWELQSYRKDCNLICCGELIPNEEEALLNRFILLDTKEPFLIKKNVKDEDEFRKYKELDGEEVSGDYLTTGEVQKLAKHFYRPRFLNILKNKRLIDFEKPYREASKITESVAKLFGGQAPDTRIINNLSTAIAGYMLLYGDNYDEDEIRCIVSEFITNYLEYKKDSYVSGRIVNYIKDNIGYFCSWTNKVKGTNQAYPMIYLKNSLKEKGISIQIANISRYMQTKIDSPLNPKHIESQLRSAFGISRLKARPVNAAKGTLKLGAVFIDYDTIKNNEILRELWDVSLDYLGEHVKELKKLKEEPQVKYSMADLTLVNLIEEIDNSYEVSDFFDTDSYSKEKPKEELPDELIKE